MPRATFATSMLSGMQPGLSKLAGALTTGDQAFQMGAQQGQEFQTKMAQALAQIDAAKAQQRLHDAQAGEVERKTSLLNGRPGLAEEQIAFQLGTDVPTIQAYRQQATTGQAPQVPMGPPTEDGQFGQGTLPVNPALRSKIGQALARMLPVLSNSGDLNPEQLAKAAGAYRDQDISDAIIAGTMDRNKVGGAEAAVNGKPLFNVDSTGAVLDQYGGGLNTANPLAQSTISLRGAQAGAQRAAAADHYAGAGEKNARTAQIKQESAGQGKAPLGYRWAPDGQSLVAIPGGPAAKDAPTEGERKAGSLLMRLRGSQQQMLAAIGRQASAEKPIAAAEFVRAIPWIGGDTPANLLTPEARQQVEAAQLDMLDAALTLGTGAAYTKEQLRGYAKSYFPQIGDKPQALEDKRIRLANVIRAAEIAAGRAASQAVPAAAADRSVTVDY